MCPARSIRPRAVISTRAAPTQWRAAGTIALLPVITLSGILLGFVLAGSILLIDPLGRWRDDLPVKNWMILRKDKRRGALFADPDGAAAERFFELPADPAARVEAQAGFIWSQACTGKFVWPIPDKGLKKRIHRIAAATLIIWGRRIG